jgi:hypothetical protein
VHVCHALLSKILGAGRSIKYVTKIMPSALTVPARNFFRTLATIFSFYAPSGRPAFRRFLSAILGSKISGTCRSAVSLT